ISCTKCRRSIRLVLLISVTIALSALGRGLTAKETGTSHPIRVAIYADAGATKTDVPQVEHCLPASKGFKVKSVTAEQIRSGTLKDFDVLIHPGGAASKQSSTLDEKGR